jgi:anti-sigma B factor antagonist
VKAAEDPAEPHAHVTEERLEGATCVISVEGEADLDLAPELGARLKTAVADETRVIVVDLSRATLLDSTVLGVLVRVAKRVRPLGTQLLLVVPQPQLRRIFEITLLDRVLPLHGTVEEALSAAAAARVSSARERGRSVRVTPRRISTTHGPRLDEELARETSALREGAGARARDEREPEAPFAGEAGDDVGVTGVEEDPVLGRRELSRQVRMTVFPADRDALVAEAEANQAPDWVLRLLRRLPAGERFGTLYEVWDAAGGELEPGVAELLAERSDDAEQT